MSAYCYTANIQMVLDSDMKHDLPKGYNDIP